MDSQTKDKSEKYNFFIEHINHLPSKKSYISVEEYARAGLKFGQTKFRKKISQC